MIKSESSKDSAKLIYRGRFEGEAIRRNMILEKNPMKRAKAKTTILPKTITSAREKVPGIRMHHGPTLLGTLSYLRGVTLCLQKKKRKGCVVDRTSSLRCPPPQLVSYLRTTREGTRHKKAVAGTIKTNTSPYSIKESQ